MKLSEAVKQKQKREAAKQRAIQKLIWKDIAAEGCETKFQSASSDQEDKFKEKQDEK